MNKKIFICFFSCFLLSFLFLNTNVHANDISFEDFTKELEKNGQNWSLIQNASSSADISSFINMFNSSTTFGVIRDFGWTLESPDTEGPHYFYICFSNVQLSNTSDKWRFRLPSTTSRSYYYKLNLDTNVLIPLDFNTTDLMTFSIVSYPQFSMSNWATEETAYYFLSHSVLFGQNYSVNLYINNAFQKSYSFTDFKASPFPWDKPGLDGGGSGGTTTINTPIGKYPKLLSNFKGLYTNSGDLILDFYYPSGDTDVDYKDLIFNTYIYQLNSSGEAEIVTRANYKMSIDAFYKKFSYSNNIFSTSYFADILGELNNGDYGMKVWVTDSDNNSYGSTGIFSLSVKFSNTVKSEVINGIEHITSDDSTSINSIFATTKTLATNIFSFWDVFPSWFLNLLKVGLSVCILLRILGR